MQVKIQQWGNSAAICLSREILQQLSLKVGDVLNVEVSNNKLFLRSASPEYTMTELLADSPKSSFSLSGDDKVWLNTTVGKEE